MSATWREDGWFFGLGVIVVYAFAFLGLLDVFVRRTWLTDAGMFQRSMFGATKFAPYGQIQELLIKRDEALIVKYRGDRSLKIHAKEGDPEAVIEAMRQFLDPEIRVVTV